MSNLNQPLMPAENKTPKEETPPVVMPGGQDLPKPAIGKESGESTVDIVRCRGSFQLGTACGQCSRCHERGYDPEKREQARKAEEERKSKLPPDRVKKRGHQTVEVVVTDASAATITEKKI